MDIEEYMTNPDDWMKGDEGLNLDPPDMINNPPHYGSLDPDHPDLECIDAQKAMVGPGGFTAHLKCQIAKYVWRAGRKGTTKEKCVEDLKKARFYINDLIQMYEGN